MNETDTAAVEGLRNFAMANGEIQFAHLCTAALAGEEWAEKRVADARSRLLAFVDGRNNELNRVYVLRSTDCTRPDGAIARSIEL